MMRLTGMNALAMNASLFTFAHTFAQLNSTDLSLAGLDLIDLIFNAANLFVLPFWLLMLLLPKWKVTKAVINSPLPFVVLAIAYLYLFVGSLSSDNADSFANPTLPVLAQLFSDPKVMATGWVHYLVMDLFVGRWIYNDGQTSGVWTVHSLIFCLFAGPIGLLSHLTTRGIVALVQKSGDRPDPAQPA